MRLAAVIGHVHSGWERRAPPAMQGPMRAVLRGCPESRVSQQGLWSAGFVVTRGWGALLQFFWEVVIGSLNKILGWQGGEPR